MGTTMIRREYDYSSCVEIFNEPIIISEPLTDANVVVDILVKQDSLNDKKCKIIDFKKDNHKPSMKDRNDDYELDDTYILRFNKAFAEISTVKIESLTKAVKIYARYNRKHFVKRYKSLPRYYRIVDEFYKSILEIIHNELNSKAYNTGAKRAKIRNRLEVLCKYRDCDKGKKSDYLEEIKSDIEHELYIHILDADFEKDIPYYINYTKYESPNKLYECIRITILNRLRDLVKKHERIKNIDETESIDKIIIKNNEDTYKKEYVDATYSIEYMCYPEELDIEYIMPRIDCISDFCNLLFAEGKIAYLLGIVLVVCDIKNEVAVKGIHKLGYDKYFILLFDILREEHIYLDFSPYNIDFSHIGVDSKKITSDNISKFKNHGITYIKNYLSKRGLSVRDYIR